jgi:hypothetical protein
MKRMTYTMIAALGLAVFNISAYAEADAPPPPVPPQHSMGGGGGMDEAHMDARLRQMQESMLKSYDYMRQIRDSKDEKEQARLKDEWLKDMKQHLHGGHGNQMPQQLKMHGMPEHTAPAK